MAMDSPACAATIATNAGQARARRSGTLSPSGNGTSPTRAIQSANAAGSLRRISSAVRPSQRPIAISRSAGIMVGVSPCGEAMISAVRRARSRSLVNTGAGGHEAPEPEGGHDGCRSDEEPGDAEPQPGKDQGQREGDRRRARAEADSERSAMALDPRRRKAPREEGRGRPGERRQNEERAPAQAGRGVGDRRGLEKREEGETDRAEGADTAVAHDAEPVLGVATDEAVEAVRQAIEGEAAGQDLPPGHRAERGEERGEEDTRHALDADQHEPNAEPDDREPDRRASERVHVVRRAPRQRHDRQEAHSEGKARHPAMLARWNGLSLTRARPCSNNRGTRRHFGG